MRLWIALAAGLSLGQTPGVTPVRPPQDPSIRDPAAEALTEAYERAAEEAEGARPPPGYIIQQPLNGGVAPMVLTPTLPDGSAPATEGQLANEETARVYQPLPSPWAATANEEAAIGGSGSPTFPSGADVADTAAPEPPLGEDDQTTPPGVTIGPTRPEFTGPDGTQPGSAQTGVATQTRGPQAGGTGQDATGGAGTAGTSGQDATGGGAGTAGTSGQNARGGADGTSGQDATGGAGAAGTGTPQSSPQPSPMQQQLTQLQARVQQLEAELKARDAELAESTATVQQHIDGFSQRAVEVEQARQLRLSQIQTAGQWLLAADEALQIGELGVGNALNLADTAFANVSASAAEYGQGNVVVHAERARALINRAQEAAGNRDVYGARLALSDAGIELSLARAASLQRQGTGNVLLTP